MDGMDGWMDGGMERLRDGGMERWRDGYIYTYKYKIVLLLYIDRGWR